MNRRHTTLGALAWGIPALSLLALLGTAEAIVSHGLVLAAVIVGLPVAAFLAGRWPGRRGNAALARLRDDDGETPGQDPVAVRHAQRAGGTAVTAEKDRYRTLTAAAVLLVAAIAACVSFIHIEALAIRYGQPVLAAYLLPVSIDGTVAVSSLALLRSARAGISSPWLARTGLVLSVGATIACNVGYGLAHGLPGALLSGWPAVAFIVSAETAIGMSRRTRSAPAPVPEPMAVPAALAQTAPADSEHAARLAIAASAAAGNPLSQRQVMTRFGLSRAAERKVRALVLSEANGHPIGGISE